MAERRSRAVNKKDKGAEAMTDTQTQQFLEAIKIITEKSQSVQEVQEAIDRIQKKGKKSPQ